MGPRYFLNVPQMILQSSQAYEPLIAAWRKYRFPINKSQRIILTFLEDVPWSNGKSAGLGSNLGLSSASVGGHLISSNFCTELL